MTVTAVVGAQWGDEGKGRIVDYLAQHGGRQSVTLQDFSSRVIEISMHGKKRVR